MNLTLKIHGHADRFYITDYRHASEIYAKVRDESGLGSRDFPEGILKDERRIMARITYNAKVWTPKRDALMFDPYAQMQS